MRNYGYGAVTEHRAMVAGAVAAASASEVSQRIEYLGLVPVDTQVEEAAEGRSWLAALTRARPEDVTVFTRDLALLLRAGARLNDGLELLANDADVGRLRPVVLKIRS